ncbi:FmdE family protein [Poseidonibacter sp.]|uniref:FmdE family protein n=1 Tax=Poseidonibacter sp. TaxID=2321188 RepID=UPI003C780A98
MKYPDFFNDIETIKLQDKLANFLGTFENGIIEFSYLDIVKMAGHSCPTVLGAYLCTLTGLKELYKDSIPVRGEIKVSFGENAKDGVAGVIGSVIANITGATTDYGFKGINGNFNRTNLMFYNSDIKSNVRFTRLDTGKTVDIYYDPSSILPEPNQQELMVKIMKRIASKDDESLFKILWQKRVENIYINYKEVITTII